MLRKKDMYMLDSTTSGQMLENIFEACGVEPNTIPLEELEMYSNYRQDRFAVRKGIILLIMVLFLLVPLLFTAPRISSLEQIDGEKTSYRLSIDSLLPVSSITATIDGKKVPISEESKGEYTIRPDETGEMIVVAVSVNRQYDQKKIKISALDKNVPKLVSSKSKDGKIVLTLEDAESGIDWSSIEGIAMDGTHIKPVSYSEEAGQVVFEKPDISINIFIPDLAGNKLKLVLTV